VTETALSTALDMGDMAQQLALFSIYRRRLGRRASRCASGAPARRGRTGHDRSPGRPGGG
jgi:hypothetical protein